MAGFEKPDETCPRCGEPVDFVVINDATDTPWFDIPGYADAVVGHYDPDADYLSEGPSKYYFHFKVDQ